MPKFRAIEGLRGWLAWTVVISHLIQISCVYADGVGPILERAGGCAVLIFVMISGFVITHLIESRPEAYLLYLIRRFMRIFPLFAVTCIIGYYASDILAAALENLPWANNPVLMPDELISIAHSDHKYLLENILAHLVMLHGVIGNNILPNSEYAFNGPAWSLSLEWQFYILAPLLLAAVARPRVVLPLAFGIAFTGAAYQVGLLGRFTNPSFLPGAAGYFAVGIVSRKAYERITQVAHAYRSVIVPLAIAMLPLRVALIPLLVWTLLLCGLPGTDGRKPDDLFLRIYRKMLESPTAQYFGSRSYSTYLCHYLVIDVCFWLFLKIHPVSAGETTSFSVTTSLLVGIAMMVIPTTLVFSELTYRVIELPGITLGSRLARVVGAWFRILPTNDLSVPAIP